MKKISIKWSIAIALIIIGFGSCKKETEYPAITSQSSGPGYQYPITIDNLLADHWTKSGGGFYVCEIHAVPTSINPAGHNIKVYTRRNTEDVQLNPSILFMGGTLSATVSGNDVHLAYFPISGSMPFSYLVIKIVIE